MLDVKFIRENTEKCKTRLAMRGKSYDEEIDTALALDQKRRDIIGKVVYVAFPFDNIGSPYN